MARYKARYEFEGQSGNMDYLEPGDIIEAEDGTQGTVKWAATYKNQKTYEIEGFGVVYARELTRGWGRK